MKEINPRRVITYTKRINVLKEIKDYFETIK